MKRKDVILIVLITSIVLITLFKIFIGYADIYVHIPYDNPIYRLKINDKYTGTIMEVKHTINIIPKTLTFTNIADVVVEPPSTELVLGDEMKMDITGYNCYLDVNGRVDKIGCVNYNHKIMKEIDNIKPTSILVYGSEEGLSGDVAYDGDYTDDLAEVLTKKGRYLVEIFLEHQHIYSKLSFYVKVI